MANREKMLILPTRSSIQVHTQYVSKYYPRIFQTDRITGYLLQRTSWNRCFDVCLLFSVSVGAFPMGTQGRGNWYLEMTFKQEFPSRLLLSANRML